MQALDILEAEHGHILRVLDATLVAVGRARAEQSADAAYFQALAGFIAEFADGAHHAKEERVLFQALEDFGLAREEGPLHCMLAEHVLGRELRGQLGAAADSLARGNQSSLFDVLDASDRYAALLRSHIEKEDRVLYPMAAQTLPSEVFDTMVARFGEVSKASAADFARAAEGLTTWFGPVLRPGTLAPTAAARHP